MIINSLRSSFYPLALGAGILTRESENGSQAPSDNGPLPNGTGPIRGLRGSYSNPGPVIGRDLDY